MKLSIITINLNNSYGLDRTIQSVICQKFPDFEFIVIDGGSSDKSQDIINMYSDKIDYWISEKDQGVYHAMNKGICKSQGDYYYFLNSGDLIVDSNVIEKVFAEADGEDIIFGNTLVVLNNKIISQSKGKNELSLLDIYSGLLKHQATFIKRSLFDKFGLYNEGFKIISDWEFFIRSIGFGEATYRYLDLNISYFDNTGISNNNKDLVAYEKSVVIDKYIPVMIRRDYEYLIKYAEYEILTKFRITNFLLRVLTKFMKVINNLKEGQ